MSELDWLRPWIPTALPLRSYLVVMGFERRDRRGVPDVGVGEDDVSRARVYA